MFTGIIETKGRVREINTLKGKAQFEVEAPRIFLGPLKIGGSVSVSGVCLTVVKKTKHGILFDLSQETKKRSTLGDMHKGSFVNLERPMKWQSRLEGHFVLGHVDGVGHIKKIAALGKEKSLLVTYPKSLKRFVIEKGSIAIDGVSLTIGRVVPGAFWVHIIPHTLKTTCFAESKKGETVNLEADILLKFLAKT